MVTAWFCHCKDTLTHNRKYFVKVMFLLRRVDYKCEFITLLYICVEYPLYEYPLYDSTFMGSAMPENSYSLPTQIAQLEQWHGVEFKRHSNQLRRGLMKKSKILLTSNRHFEHLHETVWCQTLIIDKHHANSLM